MIIENIYKFIDYKGITAYKMSKKIKISNGYLAKTLQSKGNVGGHILEKIVSCYPEINAEWLITGKGAMLKNRSSNEVSSAPTRLGIDNLKDKLIDSQDKIIAIQEKEIERLGAENHLLTEKNHLLNQTSK